MTVISLWIHYYYQKVVLIATFWLPIWSILLTLSKSSSRDEICRNCFHGCSSLDRKNHEVNCYENEAARIVSPEEKKKLHQFKSTRATRFVPLVKYFDTEAPSRAYPYMFSRTKSQWTDEVGKTCSDWKCICDYWARKWQSFVVQNQERTQLFGRFYPRVGKK